MKNGVKFNLETKKKTYGSTKRLRSHLSFSELYKKP